MSSTAPLAAVGQYGEQAVLLSDGQSLRGWLPIEDAGNTKALARLFGQFTQASPGDAVEIDDDELVE